MISELQIDRLCIDLRRIIRDQYEIPIVKL
jgi:hypothetical protein